MKILSWVLILTAALAVSPVRADSLIDFEQSLGKISAEALPQLKDWHPQASQKQVVIEASTFQHLADEKTFQRLIARARKASPLSAPVNGTSYQIYIVDRQIALPGQGCPAGYEPNNTLYVAIPDNGLGEEVYPVRLTSTCVSPARTKEKMLVTTDAHGIIREILFFDPSQSSQGLVINPWNEQKKPRHSPTLFELSRQEAYLAALVKLLSEAP